MRCRFRIKLGYIMSLLAVCLCLLAVPLSTQGADEDCTGTTLATTNCLFEHYKTADTILNTVYRKAMKTAAERGPKDAAKLRGAQRKWIAYRDATCQAAYTSFGGGSGGPAEKALCLLQITRERTEHLKSDYPLIEKSK
jgi:uncharacterized protein YecT (DUF1311 family)